MKIPHSNLIQTDSSEWRPASAFSASATVSHSSETLLVVDDDPMVLDVEAQILRLQGYTVLEAQSADEALQLAREGTPIHLLITDLSMPGVDGFELTRRFRKMHPETPILMVSGSLQLLRDTSQDLDNFEFLAKPFPFNALISNVRKLLDASVVVPGAKP